MTKKVKEASGIEAWESGALGMSEEHAQQAPENLEKAIDAALELQLISIRLPKHLIEGFKYIAGVNNIKYQTLMRQVLDRFVVSELKNMAKGKPVDSRKKHERTAPVSSEKDPDFPQRESRKAA